LEMLVKGSGILPEVVRERGYCSVRSADDLTLRQYQRQQRRTPGLLLPVCPPDGSAELTVYRPSNPREQRNDKVLKYEVPKGAGLRIDVSPRCRAQLGDPSTTLYITEASRNRTRLPGMAAALSPCSAYGVSSLATARAAPLLALIWTTSR
jgi:hypothetical protein